MVRGLKNGKEVLKVRVSDLKSEGWNLLKFEQVKKNTPIRLIALFCCKFFLIFLRTLLENHEKRRMLYMSHMVWDATNKIGEESNE